jgi:hypothetical protein
MEWKNTTLDERMIGKASRNGKHDEIFLVLLACSGNRNNDAISSTGSLGASLKGGKGAMSIAICSTAQDVVAGTVMVNENLIMCTDNHRSRSRTFKSR